MKACIIQPPYSTDFSKSDEYFRWELDAMNRCDESMDLIVLPESCDSPCYAATAEQYRHCYETYTAPLLEAASATAKRCGAVLFVNGLYLAEGGLRNTTYAFNKEGTLVGKYFKQHLTPGEVSTAKLDAGYTNEFSAPYYLDIDGVRYGFLICYDFYFYEMFANMARCGVDVIIGCSHQRTDTHDALETINKFCAYNCCAYLVRASVSMGEDAKTGGASMIVAPDGKVLADLENRAGMATAEFDPHRKYLKPAGFGNPDSRHYEYIEKGRRPWKYRQAGSSVVPYDDLMPYPRLCAHRGFSTVAPENSMPAFGAAVALGAQEIELDLWRTADCQVVSIHDPTLERVSDGSGAVYQHTYDELKALDFGVKFSERFKGLRVVHFEDILKQFAGRVIMNIHIKHPDLTSGADEEFLKKIVSLITQYDCVRHVYFMTENDAIQQQLARIAPHIPRCCGENLGSEKIVDRALRLGCTKVQFYKPEPYFEPSEIERAHQNGLLCNMFWSDDPEEAKQFLEMGIDTILTNDYLRIASALNI